jgi:hypothetical protein
LQGLKNVTKVPVAYEVVMFLQTITVTCTNPAGGSDTAQGVPFDQVVSLRSVQTDQAFKILKNGRFLSDIVFHDPDIIQALNTAGVRTCNQNWHLKQIIVNSMQVFGTLFADTDPNPSTCNVSDPRNTCAIEDALGEQCSAPTNQDLSGQFTYNCDTLCQGTSCPQPPEELQP